MATKRALEAIKRIRANVEAEAVAAGDRRWAESPSYAHFVNKQLETKLPDGRSFKDLGQDWNKLKADFPYSRGFLDNLQNFYEDRVKSIDALPVGFTPAVYEAVLAKAQDVTREGEFVEGPLKELVAQLDKQYEYLDEKQRFLLEVKIDHVLEEHPQWVEEIYHDLENFNFEHPSDGTVFASE